MLDKIHSSHLGIVKCKSRAREVLFWPSMNSDIEEKVSRCAICALNQPQNPKERLIPIEIPDRPCSKIGVDLFEFKGQHYLVSVDYFSKWPEINKLDNVSSKNVLLRQTHFSKMVHFVTKTSFFSLCRTLLAVCMIISAFFKLYFLLFAF